MNVKEEQSWFQLYTWNQERETDEVFVVPQPKVAKNIRSVIEQYLDHIGFTSLDADKIMKDKSTTALSPKFRREYSSTKVHAWKINLVHKTYQLYMYDGSNPIAWPSQLKDFMEKYKANLGLRKFGI